MVKSSVDGKGQEDKRNECIREGSVSIFFFLVYFHFKLHFGLHSLQLLQSQSGLLTSSWSFYTSFFALSFLAHSSRWAECTFITPIDANTGWHKSFYLETTPSSLFPGGGNQKNNSTLAALLPPTLSGKTWLLEIFFTNYILILFTNFPDLSDCKRM